MTDYLRNVLKSVIGGGKSFCFALTLSSLTLPVVFASCGREATDPTEPFDTRTLTDSTDAAGSSAAVLTVDTTWAADTIVYFGGDTTTIVIPDSIAEGDAADAV